MNWKYWVIRKMNPNSEKNATVTEPQAAVKRGLRNSVTSSIGARTRRSQRTNPPSSPAASAKPARLRALLQPWSGASMIVNTSSAMPAVESTKPRRSSAGALGSREVGTLQRDQRGGHRGHGRHREEDARPGEVLEQPAADDRPERDRHARRGSPQPDRAGALGALGEDVGDQRQRRGEHHRRAQAHEAARDDQRAGARGQAAREAREAEQGEAGEQHALASEPVRQLPAASRNAANTRL